MVDSILEAELKYRLAVSDRMELARMAGVGERKLFFTVQGGGEEEGVQEVRRRG